MAAEPPATPSTELASPEKGTLFDVDPPPSASETNALASDNMSNASTPRAQTDSSLTKDEPSGLDDLQKLQKQVFDLQELLRASEAKVAMWEECMQTLMHSMLLSPDMNDMYKTVCVDLLQEVHALPWILSVPQF
jgi:hypothetical protein